jgi:hypothetical protein
VRARGYAELVFEQSARLLFARIAEKLDFDTANQGDAWVVDDRRISLTFEADLSAAEVALYHAMLEEFSREAARGEAHLDADGFPRWSAVVGRDSGIPAPISDSTSLDATVADTDVAELLDRSG